MTRWQNPTLAGFQSLPALTTSHFQEQQPTDPTPSATVIFFLIIQHVPLFVIPAFSGDHKGDAEMPESHILLFREGDSGIFRHSSFAEWRKNRNDNLKVEIVEPAE